MRKFNKTGDFRINSEMGGDSEELDRTDKYLEILQPFAETVLQLCPYKDLLYARQGEICTRYILKIFIQLSRFSIIFVLNSGSTLP